MLSAASWVLANDADLAKRSLYTFLDAVGRAQPEAGQASQQRMRDGTGHGFDTQQARSALGHSIASFNHQRPQRHDTARST